MSSVLKILETDNGEQGRLNRARTTVAREISAAADRSLTKIMTITPEIATVLLERNPASENRKMSATVVDRYATDMLNGRWQGLNGQTIVVSDDGELNDGQHRLAAIVETGLNVETIVVFGARRDSRLTLDQNRVRTSGDYLEMVGVKNAKNVAAAARIVMQVEAGLLGSLASGTSLRITKAEIHAFVTENLPDIERAFDEMGSDWQNMPAAPARLAAAQVLIYRRTRKWAEPMALIRSIISGENLSKTSPAYQARERLLSDKIAKTQSQLRVIECVVRAWNMHVGNKRTTRFSLFGTLPEIKG